MEQRDDLFTHFMEATHTYGEPETIRSYRDRDGTEWWALTSTTTVEVRIRTRRRVYTTYPDGTTREGWETLSETTAPYEPGN